MSKRREILPSLSQGKTVLYIESRVRGTYLCNERFNESDATGMTLTSKMTARILREGAKDRTRVLSVRPLFAMGPTDMAVIVA